MPNKNNQKRAIDFTFSFQLDALKPGRVLLLSVATIRYVHEDIYFCFVHFRRFQFFFITHVVKVKDI